VIWVVIFAKFDMDTCKILNGHLQILKWTPAKYEMDTCKMQVMHKFVLVLNDL
jgi:hypothetical protein